MRGRGRQRERDRWRVCERKCERVYIETRV